MIVYIEDCLIENFLVTLLLLLCLNKIFKINCGKTRMLGVCIFAGVISTFYPLISFSKTLEIIFKLCTGFLIVYFYSGKDKVLAKYICFIFLTALYGGINILVYYFTYGTLEIKDNFPTYILIVILFVVYYLFCSCLKLMSKRFVVCNFVYQIQITNNNQQFCDTAYLDSGNTLTDETGEPIFIINYKLFNKLYSNIKIEDILIKNYKNLKQPHYVMSGFASGGGKILVFVVDKIEIVSNQTKIVLNNAHLGLVYSKFNKNFNCNMLLNINAFA